MVVNRLLDAFFKTLDVVDAARDRVDDALGRKPRPDPWAVDWPTPSASDAESPPADQVSAQAEAPTDDAAHKDDAPKAEPADETSDGADAKPAKKKAAAKKKTAKKKTATKTASKKKTAKKSRKGSVDRSGKDFESERADRVAATMATAKSPILTEDADYNGKKVLGRVLWALNAAEQAGETDGLTTADVSALLHLTAKMDVFSTNVGRACRDHSDLIAVGKPDGRSKRYVLTDAGRTAATSIPTGAN